MQRREQVHDARLVAAMKVRGVGRSPTFNSADSRRYDIDVLHPSSVLAGNEGR
jgi:hypothetical protein